MLYGGLIITTVGMTTLGSGKFTYEVTGEDWGNLPDGWTYKDGTAVAVDSHDNVYVFNRGTHHMIVFNREGETSQAGSTRLTG